MGALGREAPLLSDPGPPLGTLQGLESSRSRVRSCGWGCLPYDPPEHPGGSCRRPVITCKPSVGYQSDDGEVWKGMRTSSVAPQTPTLSRSWPRAAGPSGAGLLSQATGSPFIPQRPHCVCPLPVLFCLLVFPRSKEESPCLVHSCCILDAYDLCSMIRSEGGVFDRFSSLQ